MGCWHRWVLTRNGSRGLWDVPLAQEDQAKADETVRTVRTVKTVRVPETALADLISLHQGCQVAAQVGLLGVAACRRRRLIGKWLQQSAEEKARCPCVHRHPTCRCLCGLVWLTVVGREEGGVGGGGRDNESHSFDDWAPSAPAHTRFSSSTADATAAGLMKRP